MKPPPRARTKPSQGWWSEPKTSRKLSREWSRRELKRLMTGLKKISWTGQNRDVNFAFLKEILPARSTSQLSSMVDSLKTKLISGVSFQLQKIRWEEERSRKPVDEWTHLASALAGTLEVVLSAAFSQMLIVSSAEPCTLRNCDPFPVHRPPTSPTSLTHSPTGEPVPVRLLPRGPHVQDKVPATISLPLFLKTPAPTMGPARRLLAPCQVVRLPNRTCFSSQFASSSQTVSIWKGSSTGQARPGFSSVQATVKGGRSETSTLLSSPQTSLSPSPVPTSTPQSFSVLSRCPSTPPTFPPSSPTAAYHPRFGQSSKHATKDHLTAITVTSVVDFEKIYNFLSAVQNPSDDCHLTPMESAIVLDLLMSLPEELCLMDCTNLHRHMIQVYQSLSAPFGSKMASELLMKVEHEPGFQAMDSACSPQSDPFRTADRPHVSDGGEKNEKLNELGGANMLECSPPLNPFMVPLKLLQRRQTSGP